MKGQLDVEQLKRRLEKLGVQVESSPQTDGNAGGASLSPRLERYRQDVASLLNRCQKVENVLKKSEAAAVAKQVNTKQLLLPDVPQLPEPARITAAAAVSSPCRSIACQQQDPRSTGRVQKLRPASAKPRKSVSPTAERPHSSPRPSKPGSAAAIVHSPLASVLAQYKEAENIWAQEKAKLRREAVNQRKRANKAELEYERLQRLHEHKSVDMRAMKNALKSRDQELHAAQMKIKELEEAFSRVNGASDQRVSELETERDDLKALLVATLERLEGVEDVVQRANVSTNIMEDKMKQLEAERLKAVEASAKALAEAADLAESKRRLQWQSQLLEHMSEVQMRHNQRKTAAIKELLRGDTFDYHAQQDDTISVGSDHHQDSDGY